MSLPQLPVLPLKIEKDGNRSGIVRVDRGDGTEEVLAFTGSLPFSRLTAADWRPFFGQPGLPDSRRMAFVRDCLAAIEATAPQGPLPTRFRTLDGEKWKIDRKVLCWLLGEDWEAVADGAVPDARIRRRR